MTTAAAGADAVWALLDEVADPEIPCLSIGDLGIVRDVGVEGGRAVVTITPTYSGCPAMGVIRREVEAALAGAGFTEVHVDIVHSPAWTTDWMSDRGRRRLAAEGIAPPSPTGRPDPVLCPRCAGEARVVSEFGSTACKALMVCTSCGEPFHHFKAI